MPTIKSNPAVWLPKRGQWFEATVKRFNKRHAAGPFKCTDIIFNDPYPYLVEAVDSGGDTFEIRLRDFSFSALSKDARLQLLQMRPKDDE